MKRLREEVSSADPNVAEAARLMVALAPLAESEVRSGRVLRSINRKQQVKVARLSRPLLAALLLMGTAATAGAAFGVSEWISARDVDSSQAADLPHESASRSLISPPVTSPSGTSPAITSTPPTVAQNEQSATSEASPVAAEEGRLPEIQQVPSAKSSSSSKQSVSQKTSSAAKSQAASSSPASQAVLVQRAVEALRHSNNPGQAAALLKEYRLKAPSGALAEEALALSIEVAVAQGSAQARVYAAQYLKSYPRGRFRSLAESALR